MQIQSSSSDGRTTALAGKSFIRKFDAPRVIFEEGAAGSEFYIILSGAVAIKKR